MLNLCLSDFTMGVYLAIICAIDALYGDVYIWKERQWRKSIVCKVKGSYFDEKIHASTSVLFCRGICFDFYQIGIRIVFKFVSFDASNGKIRNKVIADKSCTCGVCIDV